MKLTAYDLAQDKSAILAAVLERNAKPVAPEKPKKITVSVRATKPKKPKPQRDLPRVDSETKRPRAALIELMLADGWFKADILDELGITSKQYEADRRWTKYNLNKRVFGSNKAFEITAEVLDDMKKMTTGEVAKKYNVSPSHITRMRRVHGVPSKNRPKLSLMPEHNVYIDSRMSARQVAELTGLSIKQVKYARQKRGWRGGALQ